MDIVKSERKRKVQFEDPIHEKPEPKRRTFKEGHSLDSDEEEEGEHKKKIQEGEDVLDDEDIEGQEEETMRFDGETPITPFNLKDEMQEGHFDTQGNYIANKDDQDVTDGWLDSVDWNRVKTYKDSNTEGKVNEIKESDEEDDKMTSSEQLKSAEEMVAILKPGETILRCLRRLGGGNKKKHVSSQDRWKQKKLLKKQQVSGEKPVVPVESEEERVNKVNLLRMTELADRGLSDGDFQIYEKTYEQLAHAVKEMRTKMESSAAPSGGQFEDVTVDVEDGSDDELEGAFKEGSSTTSVKSSSTNCTNKQEEPKPMDFSSEVQWMYKMTQDLELIGPVLNSKMMEWAENGTFPPECVLCRKVGSEGEFYSSKRVDFDLYD